MEKVKLVDSAFNECDRKKIRALDDTMDVLTGKWKVRIIARLWYKSFRFSELLSDLNGISGKVLSRELDNLEINGLVHRIVSQGKPLTVTYELSQYGKSLKALTDSMADWGIQHRMKMLDRHLT